ncbi:perlucin-like [Haliotis rufescens]|uniref:perlucin-like n=1 Tax=Haliotis rufescens TaxID=6454 RepID=UPI001EB04389|nr:perlucin-like [Haliotis rufescens]
MRLEVVSFLLLTFASLAAAHGRCPLGFLRHGDSCYWISTTVASFAEAKTYCQYMQSHLARITSKVEDDFLRGHVRRRGKGTDYWLGATDMNVEGKWLWEGNKAMTYTNWDRNNPNNDKGVENCLGLRKEFNYKWNDYQCHHRLNFICEKNL